jgi:SAM-dependent methyltransferase
MAAGGADRPATFDELISEALAAPFSGWDFSWLAARSPARGLPWSYGREVARRALLAETMLDMGTGGGEVLSRLAARSRHTVATEAWPPNVPIAASRLVPLGIPVVRDEGAADNMRQDGSERGRLPFRDAAFGLVANRHEAFRADEVSRVLAPGGAFVTQHVDFHSFDELYRLVGLEPPDQPESWLPIALRQVRDAGLTVQAAVRGEERYEFRDVGAVAYYLRVISWGIPEYSLDRCGAALRAAHEDPSQWPALVRQRRFLMIAVKP